jgi:hypothetical protein
LKELPLEEAQRPSQWLQKYLHQPTLAKTEKGSAGAIRLPDLYRDERDRKDWPLTQYRSADAVGLRV